MREELVRRRRVMRAMAGLVGASALAGVLTAGCVTINIYFPAAAAEKAADKIIEEVYQLNKKAAEPSSAPEKK